MSIKLTLSEEDAELIKSALMDIPTTASGRAHLATKQRVNQVIQKINAKTEFKFKESPNKKQKAGL